MQSGLREEEEEADTDVDLLTNIKKNSGPTLIGLDLENHGERYRSRGESLQNLDLV